VVRFFFDRCVLVVHSREEWNGHFKVSWPTTLCAGCAIFVSMFAVVRISCFGSYSRRFCSLFFLFFSDSFVFGVHDR